MERMKHEKIQEDLNGINGIYIFIRRHHMTARIKADDADELLCQALAENDIKAVAITDHFKIDKTRIEHLRKLAPEIVFFPGVELRTDKGANNLHLIINPVLLHKFKGYNKEKTANQMKVWDAKPEEAKVRKFDQVSRWQLFRYHIWKRCESGRDLLDNFYTFYR